MGVYNRGADMAITAVRAAMTILPHSAPCIAADIATVHRGSKATALAHSKLWTRTRRLYARNPFEDLKLSRPASEHWDVWTHWYNLILEGKEVPLAEQLGIYRVMLNSETDWRRGFTHINALVLREQEGAKSKKRDQGISDALRELASKPLRPHVQVSALGLSLDFAEGEQSVDPLAARMHGDVLKFVQRLADRTPLLMNSHKDCAEDARQLFALLDQPFESVVNADVEVWNLSLALGEHLTEDKLNRAAGNASLRPFLEADDRRALEAAVSRLGPWVRFLPNARRLDDEYRNYNARPQSLDAVTAIIEQSNNRMTVLEQSTKSLILMAVKTASGQGEQASKAGGFVVEGTKSLARSGLSISRRGIVKVLTGAVIAGIGKKVGEEIADETGLAKEISKWLASSADAIRELFADDPADVREAVDKLLDAPDDTVDL